MKYWYCVIALSLGFALCNSAALAKIDPKRISLIGWIVAALFSKGGN